MSERNVYGNCIMVFIPYYNESGLEVHALLYS